MNENWIARLREPSTYAALAAGLSTVGVTLSPGALQNLTLAGTALSVLLGVLLRERRE
jgi:hypothetical protein